MTKAARTSLQSFVFGATSYVVSLEETPDFELTKTWS
jgi:hypothetical protein